VNVADNAIGDVLIRTAYQPVKVSRSAKPRAWGKSVI
jgi:hypothetical protein